jgi:hypothetical protein
MVASVALHALAAVVGSQALAPSRSASSELVDIEIAPPVPLPEALPPEVQRPPLPPARDRPGEPEPASTAPHDPEPGEAMIDAGVDAAVDAAIDARPDARPDAARPDAARDAGLDAPTDAAGDADLDAGVPEAIAIAAGDGDADRGDAGPEVAAAADRGDAGPEVAATPADDAGRIAADAGPAEIALAEPAGPGSAGSGPAATARTTAGSDGGSGSALDTAALAQALAGAGSGGSGATGIPGVSDEVAVDGAPTTAGTAANLLSYFPDGHVLTALIRFDRLRGTEWSAQTERLLRPMPDYQLLFGARDADITAKLETLVISTPRPRDAAATTLVARTELARPALRAALGQGSPVTWSAARGGLLGRRTGKRFAGDERVFLSPFPGWFLLARPGDLGGLTAPPLGKVNGAINDAVATGALPPWLAGIRGIEREAGDARGPALVVTVALDGKRLRLGAYAIGLGATSIPSPDRISLATELVPQGWLVRGNLRFAADADAGEFVASVQHIQHSVADSRAIQLLLGKPIARVIAALAFARNGPRVSYATSISIADARAILAFAAQQIDDYFAGAAGGSPPGRSAPPPGAPPPQH